MPPAVNPNGPLILGETEQKTIDTSPKAANAGQRSMIRQVVIRARQIVPAMSVRTGGQETRLLITAG
jgi:hypothetical protein